MRSSTWMPEIPSTSPRTSPTATPTSPAHRAPMTSPPSSCAHAGRLDRILWSDRVACAFDVWTNKAGGNPDGTEELRWAARDGAEARLRVLRELRYREGSCESEALRRGGARDRQQLRIPRS